MEIPCLQYTVQELRDNQERQKEIFAVMLKELEQHGKCRRVYHALAIALYNDSLGDS